LEEVTDRIIGILHTQGVRPRQAAQTSMSTAYRIVYQGSKTIFRILYGMEVHHVERARIPGGAYFASNHASFLDPPLIGTALDEPIYYLARNTLFNPPFFAWLLPQLNTVPVDRDNAELSSLRISMQVVKEGKKMVVFPEVPARLTDRFNLPCGALVCWLQKPVCRSSRYGFLEVTKPSRAARSARGSTERST